MDWLTNESLFYSGMIVTICSLLIAIVLFCVSKIKSIKLKTQLEIEYGEEKNVKSDSLNI